MARIAARVNKRVIFFLIWLLEKCHDYKENIYIAGKSIFMLLEKFHDYKENIYIE